LFICARKAEGLDYSIRSRHMICKSKEWILWKLMKNSDLRQIKGLYNRCRDSKYLGLSTIRLMTNNPKKIKGLEEFGIKITERVPIIIHANQHNQKYLSTKKAKLGHMMEEFGFVKK
jgi:hypothetical protein